MTVLLTVSIRPDRSTCSSSKIVLSKRIDWTKKEVEDNLDTEHNPDVSLGRNPEDIRVFVSSHSYAQTELICRRRL